MHHRALLTAAIVLSGCSQTLSTPVRASTSANPEDTFACVRKQLGEIGYKQSSVDFGDNRINGIKIDTHSRRPDTQFRRILNKLDIEVAAESDGQTSIKVVPNTFAEYTTQRGPTEVQEKSSEQVKADAQQLLERCKS